MNIETIEVDFRRKVCEKLSLLPEGIDRFRVSTPFMFEDGDHIAVVLKKENGTWVLSDEGHTYMHLTYDLKEKDLRWDRMQEFVRNTLSVLNVQDRKGELFVPIQDGNYGDAFYRFVQAILRIEVVLGVA